MTIAVLDANVLASGFVRSNPAAAPVQILDAWRDRRFALIVSEHIIKELAHTFEDPCFRHRLTREQIQGALALLISQATLTPITLAVHGVATHPEDDLVLATAVSARADYLVTGDRQLQYLGSYGDVVIHSPRAFLEILTV